MWSCTFLDTEPQNPGITEGIGLTLTEKNCLVTTLAAKSFLLRQIISPIFLLSNSEKRGLSLFNQSFNNSGTQEMLGCSDATGSP